MGIFPALITLWIRKAVPETEEWQHAKQGVKPPGLSDLFSPAVRSITWRALLICAVSLTAHWAFMFWQQGFIRQHYEVGPSDAEKNHAAVEALTFLMVGSVAGKLSGRLAVEGVGVSEKHLFPDAGLRHHHGNYVLADMVLLLDHVLVRACWEHGRGVFGLFTMCLPPLFPTLLRTTGSGFCYNIGRLASAAGVVLFGIFNKVGSPARRCFMPARCFSLLLRWR